MHDRYLQPPDITRVERDGYITVPTCVFICSSCGGSIYEGDTYYRVMQETFCEDCIDGMRDIAEGEE